MQKLKLLLIAVISVLVIINAEAQISSLSEPIPPDPAIKIGKLDNGLTYYIKKNSKPEQRIELRLVVNAGSICESDGQQGLAHFMEHMCFNGTRNFPSNKIIQMLEEMGVRFGSEINAYTGFDETVYMMKIPSDKEEWIDRGFQVLEDWAHQVSFDEKEIDKERGVIIEEWRMGLGADDRMQSKYIPVLFKGSRYAERLPIGKIDVIKSFPYDTLRAFYNTWYRPDLMAVVVVGDIDPEAAENRLNKYFGRIEKAKETRARAEYPVPGNEEPLVSVVTDREATGSTIQVMFKHPAASSVTYGDYRNSLYRRIYTSILNKRLMEITRKPDAPFLMSGSEYGAFIGRSIDVYGLFAAAKENRIEESLEVIMTENERVKKFGFTESELEREKKDIYAIYENGAKEADKTESGAFADEFIRNYLTRESIPGYLKEFELVKELLPGITLDELNETGRRWTTENNMLVLVTSQEKEGISVPSEKTVTDIIKSVRTKDIEPYVDEVADVPLLEKMPAPSEVTGRVENTVFGFTELTFGNGVRMILKPTEFQNDQILLSSTSPGGTSLYPDTDIMSAMLASTVVTQSGVGSYDYMGLQKKLSGNTAKLTPFINELREGVNGSCSPKDLETMLQLNYLYFTAIRRDEDAFSSYVSRMRNMIRPMRANPQIIFTDTLTKIVTMNSPREIAVPTEAQLDQVNLDRIIGIYSDRFSDAGDFTYVMVGNFDTDEVIPLLAKYIGGLPSTGRKETWRDVTPDFPEGRVIVDVPRNSEPQSLVAMVWNGDFKWKDKERQGFAIMTDLMSIKLREAMREEQSGVYGISFEGTPSKFPTPEYTLTSSWGCHPDSISMLTQTVLSEIEKLRKYGPAEEDLNKVKETLIRARETAMKENSFWLSALQSHYMYGTRLLTLDEYRRFVNSFTTKDIRKIALRYLDARNYVKVALLPAPEVVQPSP